MIPTLDTLVHTLADAPLTAKQQAVWQDICRELVQARARLEELETKLKMLENQPEEDDPFQMVLTRPEFNREVARMLAFDERYGGISSVLYFDIENLDDIIHKRGQSLAKKAIRCVSDALMGNIRRTDILGRLATDEFGILLPRCDNASAWKKGEQIAGAVFDTLSSWEELDAKPSVVYGAYTFQEKENLAIGLREAASSVTKWGENV